jgi:hypothetical protein
VPEATSPTTVSNMKLSPTPRPARLAGSLALVFLAAAVLSGCTGFATDTPLGVTTTAKVFAPGQPVTGDVVNPDGKMTVTISAHGTPYVEGKHSKGATQCDYHSWKKKFSCPTKELPQGLYLVQVTDGDQPGEGTALNQVAVAPFKGYNPKMRLADTATDPKTGEPLRVLLTGWRPKVPVKVTLIYDGGAAWDAATVSPGADGKFVWTTKALRAGYYTIEADDGLWKIGGELGERGGAYVAFQTAGTK